MATGANSTPLGRLNPALVLKANQLGQSLLKPSYMQGTKRESEDDSSSSPWNSDGGQAKKKRRSRWGGDDKDKTFIPGMPTVLPSNLSKDQETAYLLQLQIEEVSRRLRTGDLGIPPNPEERSPSPEPIYNNEGKRLNTREYRTRKKLEDERHQFIQQMYEVNPDYKPPADYKFYQRPPVVRVSDKVMIPQEEHPDINFVGLLIGPRGNTLKAMEKETGAKIIIRGKGSVKEGKVGRKDGQPLPGEDEPLHAYVTANNPESVKKAVEKIKEIIRQGVEVPEGQNDLRRVQLRELALLNGTLRENDGPRCSNCGATSHKSWQCPDKPNVTNNVICTNCGGAGHISKDCRERRPGNVFPGGNGVDKAKIDEEYMSLMAELGEGPPPPTKTSASGTINHATTGITTTQGPPRAIMAPPATQAQQPPSLPPTVGPPPGPPSTVAPTGVSPQVLHPWQQAQQSQVPVTLGVSSAHTYSGVPPPMLLSQPPPPPPPGGQPPTTLAMPWMHQSPGGMPQGVAPPWQQPPGVPPPGPVPPPRPGAPVPPPASAMGSWQQGFMGMPPPLLGGVPPPPPPSQMNQSPSGTSAVDLNALAQAGLPNLLAAPPPPPPS